MKYARMWIREEDSSGYPNYDTQIYVDNPTVIPKQGEFIDSPISGWVALVQYSYFDQGSECEVNEMNKVIINVFLTKERP